MSPCDAMLKHPKGARVCCVVDWPHGIHLGWIGKTRVRWMDDGGRPTPEALAAFEAECEGRKLALSGR